MWWRFVLAIMLVACGGGGSPSQGGDPGFVYPNPDAPTAGDQDSTPASDTSALDTADKVMDVRESPDLVEEPDDVVSPPDEEGTPDPGFFDAGQEDPGGGLNKDVNQECEALGLAEQWDGTFDGEIKSNWGNTNVDGTMGFEISCFAGKFIVSGEMIGLGQGQPFNVKLQGTYNPETKTIKTKLTDGTVQLFWLLPVAFEGELNGVYDGTQFSGDWNGENTDKTILDATGIGTWEALPK